MQIKMEHMPQRETYPFWELQRAWYLNGQLGELVEVSPDFIRVEDSSGRSPLGRSGDAWVAFTDDLKGILVFNNEFVDDYLEGEAMKVNIGKTKSRKMAEQCQKWERVFAWRPVRVGETEGRWLEVVERRRIAVDKGFQYRPASND